MKKNYPHMLSPVKIGSHVLKNRLLSSCCMPSFLAGPESYAPESVITFFENLAKSGAALITVRDQNTNTRGTPMAHSPYWRIDDPLVQNYYSQMTERIHFQGSVIMVMVVPNVPQGYDVCEGESPAPPDFGPQPPGVSGDAPQPGPGGPINKELTHEMIQDLVKKYAQMAKMYQDVGFDGITIHMAYQGPIPAKFLSKGTNHRTDEYGGSIENRSRFPLEIFKAIKAACGKDFIIELEMSGEEPDGNTLEENIAFAKIVEDYVDIIQLRHGEIDPSHPTGYSWDGEVPETLAYAKAFKDAGIKAIISPSGGFGDFDVIEEAIASGQCDTIDMARGFMVDPDYLTKAVEGRPEDRIPCVRCNKCHNPPEGKWVNVCSVNPILGLAHCQDKMVDPPARKKKIAIVGGGPAGMRAAIYCRQRGHSVTLYEKSDKLGGQLLHADYPSFKWPLKHFKDYLVRQMEKDEGITVVMNTDATPEMLSEKDYDAIIVAIGSEPVIPPIEGADQTKVWTPISVYGHEAELGKRVVLVGGGDSSTETGMYLAECGHDVTVLTRQDALAKDNMGVHFYTMLRSKWESYPNFHFVTLATTSKVEDGKVTYQTADGEHVIECDDIVLSGGVKKDDALVMSYYGCAPEVVCAGDCVKPGALTEVNFTAYSAASRL